MGTRRRNRSTTTWTSESLERAAVDLRCEPRAEWDVDAIGLQIVDGRDDLWLVVRLPSQSQFAVRLAHCPSTSRTTQVRHARDGASVVRTTSSLGEHEVEVAARTHEGFPVLAVRHVLTPSSRVVLPFLPRDLYPLGARRDPRTARGAVEAAQRGTNAGLVFLRIDAPVPARLLYVQDLTALADYFDETGTVPDTAVGGAWPELGYLPPTPVDRRFPPEAALPAGRPIVMSRAVVVADSTGVAQASFGDEDRHALSFIQLLAAAYDVLERPSRERRDWAGLAARTVADLAEAPTGVATVQYRRRTYVRPYVSAEYPDSMAQTSVVAALHAYGRWLGEPHPLTNRLERGIRAFFDPQIGVIRRYLPNVGDDKNADAVDSWYQYHPLINLGLLAIEGNGSAESLFRESLDRAVAAAHHFDYQWPIQYDVRDLSVIESTRDGEGWGQTDVGGIYAFVMLLAAEISGDHAYVGEARAAVDAAAGYRFDLNYQANLTAWGAAGCMRLYRVTDAQEYRERAYMYLASLFHNTTMWESRIRAARHYGTFMTMTCLHDASYVAAYELFDSVRALDHVAADAGPDVDEAVRYLVGELCAYTIDRAWYAYPENLPADIIATDVRNGRIERALAFPLEDLYASGQAPGSVGQEIYGAGAGLHFAARTTHRIDGAPFDLYSDYLLHALTRTGPRTLTFGVDGAHRGQALLSLVRRPQRRMPDVRATSETGGELPPRRTDDGVEFIAPPGPLYLEW